jgi:hypothetical protein
MRGNRQILERLVKASKRFRIERDTYIIKSNAIFTKIEDGKLKSVVYYSEGNPNPHDFIGENTGLDKKFFNRLFGEDLYFILVKLMNDKKWLYLLVLYVAVLCTSLGTLITCFI